MNVLPMKTVKYDPYLIGAYSKESELQIGPNQWSASTVCQDSNKTLAIRRAVNKTINEA